ncbi:MAG TPA: hypothetical protein VM145_07870 [Sphingomicrobium sp.]|nr:hypothetical protein [Sphingomicrobium sp.]
MIVIVALLGIGAPAASHLPTTAQLAGVYEVRQMEMAGGLELKPNGHFRYAFSYGAVDEEAEGDWSFDGKTLSLTSNPMPKAASFELVKDDPAPKGELYMTLEDPGFEWGHPLEAIATADLKSGFEIEADESGRVDLAGKPPVVAIAPRMPVYGPTGQIFNLAQDPGHRLLFRFHKNDLGRARFDHQAVTVTGNGLSLERYDAEIRFIRVRP